MEKPLRCCHSRRKIVRLLLLNCVMVSACLFCTTLNKWSAVIIGWFGVVFFGWAFVVLFRNLVRAGEPSIVFDYEGITDRQTGFGFIPWQDVTKIVTHSVHGTQMLGVYVSNFDHYLSRVSSARKAGVATNVKLGFAPITLAFVGLKPGIKEALHYIERLQHASLREAE